jgi:hypothetical protein
MHHEAVDLPSVCPCDTTNESDTKTHLTSEELYCWIMGCCKFRNYKHLILVSRDGECLDGGEYPPSLGSYTTIHKANSSGPLDWKKYKYLDALHMDIAFRDCLLVGGFCCVLVGRCTVHVVAARCFHLFTHVKKFGVFRCHQNSL